MCLFVALAFITPLIVGLSSYIFPFVVPKVLYFRLLMSMAAFVLALYVALQGWRAVFYRSPLLIAVAAFFVSGILSTIMSVDSSRSLWDNHERMLGLYTLLHYGVLYLVARSVFRTWKEWRYLFIWILVAAVPMVVIAWYQLYDPHYLLNQGSERVRSTLGNTIYVSNYGLYLGALATIFAATARTRAAKISWAIVAAVGFLTMIITLTRGTVLGVGVGLLLALFLVARAPAEQTSLRTRQWALWSLYAVVVFVLAVFALRDASFVRNNGYLNRMTHFSFSSGTGGTRVLAWQTAVTAWKDHPITGWGLNNFFYAFNAYYNPAFLSYGLSETWFDNAHSMIFNTLTTMGAIGLLAYLALYWFAFTGARRMIVGEPGEVFWWVSVVVQALLIAQFIHNLFVFESITSLMLFFVLLAFIDSMTAGRTRPVATVPTPLPMLGAGAVIIAGIVVLAFGFWSHRATRNANIAIHDALNMAYAGAFKDAMQSYEKAKAFRSPHQDDIVREFATTITRTLNRDDRAKMDAYVPMVYPIVKRDLEQQIAQRPHELRMYLILAQLVLQEGLHTKNSQLLGYAHDLFTKALTMSPRRQQIIYEIAQVDMLLGLRQEGETLLLRAIDDLPHLAESYWRLGVFYAGLQDATSSARYFQETLRLDPDAAGVSPNVLALAQDVLTRVGDTAGAQRYQELLQ